MMSEEVAIEKEESACAKKVYGAKLKSARVSLQKSISDVAIQLNLHESIVKAIEEMEESKLPAPAFVKGYLRSYAKMVKIDSEVLINDYSCDKDENVLQKPSHVQIKNEKNHEPNLKIIAAIVIIIAVLFSILTWQNNLPEPDITKTEMSLDNSQIITSEKSEDEITTELDIVLDHDPIIEDSFDQLIEERENIVVALPLEQVETTDEVVQKEAQTETENITGELNLAPLAPQGTVREITRGEGDLLSIAANNDSWVEVRDDQGEVVYTNIMHAGDTRIFSVGMSYKLILGISSVLQISFAGEKVNFSKFVRSSGTARFIISKDGINPYITEP